MNEFTKSNLPEVARSQSPRVGIVLGSGLASFVDRLHVEADLPFDQIEGLPELDASPAMPASLYSGDSTSFRSSSPRAAPTSTRVTAQKISRPPSAPWPPWESKP